MFCQILEQQVLKPVLILPAGFEVLSSLHCLPVAMEDESKSRHNTRATNNISFLFLVKFD